jgi:hypothetical protein
MLKNLLLKKVIREVVIRDHLILKPRGFIVELWFDPQWTEFDLQEYIKLSRRSRRTKKPLEKETPLLQYSMLGKCIAFRKRGINSSLTIRNVISLCSYEITYAFFSTNILTYVVHDLLKKNKRFRYKRASRYELRKQSPVKSQTDFDYVIDEVRNLSQLFLDD